MPNYLHVAQFLIDGSQPATFRAYSTSSSSESVVQTAWDAAVVALWTSASFLAFFPTTTSLVGTYSSTMTSNFHQQTKTSATHSTPGTSASAAQPNQVCFVVTLRTANASKAGHGRWYLPGPAVNAIATTGNVYSTAFGTAATTALNAFGTALGSTTALQVFHRNGTRSGLPALSLSPVLGTSDASLKPGIQRRRGDKIVPTRISWSP